MSTAAITSPARGRGAPPGCGMTSAIGDMAMKQPHSAPARMKRMPTTCNVALRSRKPMTAGVW